MPIEGVDYAWDRPSVSGLKAAGKRFVVRYGGPGSDGKQIQPAELRALIAADIAVVANAEGTASGFRGYAAGRTWAEDADHHFASLGMPRDRPIYFSADWDVTSAQLDEVDAALRGAAEVIGARRVGLYGGRRVIAHAKAAGTARWLWQTYAWSQGVWVPGVHLQQYRNGVPLAGGTVDLNRAMVSDYGQWGTAGTPATPGGVGELFCVKGETGIVVRSLQTRLKNLGQDVDVDGVYGDQTSTALRAVCLTVNPDTGADGSALDHNTLWYLDRAEHSVFNAADSKALADRVTALDKRLRAVEAIVPNVPTAADVTAIRAELDALRETVANLPSGAGTGGASWPAEVVITGSIRDAGSVPTDNPA